MVIIAGLRLIAVIGEGIADWQLSAFKKDPVNRGKICDVGLWNYSRHPNYFFQSLMWIAYFFCGYCTLGFTGHHQSSDHLLPPFQSNGYSCYGRKILEL